MLSIFSAQAGDDPAKTTHELQSMLGWFGFQWLCACAVYPDLRFTLSVHLGRCLAEAVGRPPPDENEHLTLFRLPWLRSGWMPEDLRLALIVSLEPALRPVVRTAIEALLFNALDYNRRDPDAAPRLDFARPPQGWRSYLRAWMEGAPPGTPARDEIFVSYMMGRVPKPADLRLNRRLAGLFGARLAGWFDRRTLAYVVLAIGASVAVWSSADTLIKPLFTRTVTTTVTAPAMVALPGGTFLMGSPQSETGRYDDEGPQHEVTIRPFAIGKYEVTFEEWDTCVAAGGCNGYRPDDEGWGRGRHPVINVSWRDAQAYVAWLAEVTGKPYRLPSEAEWEYAARAGTKTRYAFGDEITKREANFGENVAKTTEVGAYPANAWGLYDMHGNVWEWVEDVWHDSYSGAPADGSAWTDGKQSSRFRVYRGGSWYYIPRYLRTASRDKEISDLRYIIQGFRVARTLPRRIPRKIGPKNVFSPRSSESWKRPERPLRRRQSRVVFQHDGIMVVAGPSATGDRSG